MGKQNPHRSNRQVTAIRKLYKKINTSIKTKVSKNAKEKKTTTTTTFC